jgi:hypothetical protein
MRRAILTLLTLLLTIPSLALAQDEHKMIEGALSAAPESVSGHATVMDWDNTVLREGTSSWVCFPDMPQSPGYDPMCLDEPWLNWADAWMNKKEPTYTKMGFGYMLAGGSPGSNIDPYAEGPTADNEWLDEGGPHIMIVVPNTAALEGLPTDPSGGGPWVMWQDTPYVHIMVPMPKNGR